MKKIFFLFNLNRFCATNHVTHFTVTTIRDVNETEKKHGLLMNRSVARSWSV